MFILDGKRFHEDPDKRLGLGSEGAIYPHPVDNRFCIKIFHDPDETRARKIEAFVNITNQPDLT